VDQPAPFAGFGADDGTELFIPNEQILAIEVRDLTDWIPGYTSTLGFYSASDPATLIPVFGGSDGLTSGRQVAVIDFENGRVIDADASLDSGVLEIHSPFGAGRNSIGFYLTIVDPFGAEFTLYTEPTLNTLVGGADLFASFPGDPASGQYLLGAEIPTRMGLVPVRLDLLRGLSPSAALSPVSTAVSPMPEPASEALFVAGLLVVGIAIGSRKRSAARS
jgi:hypothetical protein